MLLESFLTLIMTAGSCCVSKVEGKTWRGLGRDALCKLPLRLNTGKLPVRHNREVVLWFRTRSSPIWDRLYGLVVRVPDSRSRGPGFDSQRYQIFCEVVGLERGPLSVVNIIEELLEWKSSGSGSRKPRLRAMRIRCTDHATPSIRKSWH
jgi:hypothetical protein